MKSKSITAIVMSVSLMALTACGQQAETVSDMIETFSEPAETEGETETVTETEEETETETETETTEPAETVEQTEPVETETVTEITEVTGITEVTETGETADSEGVVVSPISKVVYATVELNARRGPGVGYDIIDSYGIGSEIEVVGIYEPEDGSAAWYQTSDNYFISSTYTSPTSPTVVTGVPDTSKGEINPAGIPMTDPDTGEIIGYDNSPAATGNVVINPETGKPAQVGESWDMGDGIPQIYGGTMQDMENRHSF